MLSYTGERVENDASDFHSLLPTDLYSKCQGPKKKSNKYFTLGCNKLKKKKKINKECTLPATSVGIFEK